jgi:phosphatidylglycerol---prolipoprotein diacylglyceryl transferase
MIPDILSISTPWGVIPIHSFGVCMVLAFLAAWKRLYLSLVESGEDPNLAEPMITWAALGGILGARVLYLASFPKEFMDDPVAAIFGGAGFVFYGGFIGGALAVWIFLKKHKKSFLFYADITAPTLALGYAIGRLGCQLSGDGDYGSATNLPWAMSYSLGVIPTPPGVLVHPAPVYESILACVILFVLLKLAKIDFFQKVAGRVFGLYLILASISRFSIEFVRIEPKVFFMLTQAQVTAILISCAGLVLMFVAKNSKSSLC